MCWLSRDRFARHRARRLLVLDRPREAGLRSDTGYYDPYCGICPGPKPLEIVFLSVGQGDAAVLSTPQGRTILIDVGTERAGERHVLPYLKRWGKTAADAVILTHEHADHIGGFGCLVGGVRVGAVVIPEGMDPAHIGPALLELATSAGPHGPRGDRMNDIRINPSDSESLSLDFIDTLLEGGEKQCPKCGKIKPAGEFYKEIHRNSGHSGWCKECKRNSMRAASKRYYRCVKTPSCPGRGCWERNSSFSSVRCAGKSSGG